MGAAAPTQQWPLAGSHAAPAPTVKQPDAASKARLKLLAPAPPPGTVLPQIGAAGVGGKGGWSWPAARCCSKRLLHAQCGNSAPAVGWRRRGWVTRRIGPPRRVPSPPAAGALQQPQASHARCAASSPYCLPARTLFDIEVRGANHSVDTYLKGAPAWGRGAVRPALGVPQAHRRLAGPCTRCRSAQKNA
jgi:hypothetical protein